MLRQSIPSSASRWLPVVILLASVAWPLPVTASAATAGELLEKAIYTEETVGDVDAAIQLYEQVLSVAKDASHAAAQAQYRLGLCYAKRGKAEQAAAAFQAVVDNFPLEQDLVAEARKHLPSQLQLLPVPWVSGERLHFSMKLTTGLEIGTMIYMIDAVEQDGRELWQCSTRGLVTANGANSFSRVLCDKESFTPAQSLWRHSMLGEAVAAYNNGRADISIVGKEDVTSLKLPANVWDNEQGVELFRRLPLQVGFKSKLTVLTSLGSRTVELVYDVPEKATIEVPAGKFECFKLVLDIGQAFWISADEHRYVTRFEAGSVVADLTRVEVQEPDQSLQVSGAGFSLSLPPGWQAYTPSDRSQQGLQRTYLLDPQAFAVTVISIGSQAELDEDERVSARAWTESYIEDAKQHAQDFKLRDPGPFVTNIGELSATAIIADHQEGGKPITVYGAALFGDASAINLRMSVATEQFDALRGEFESILNSLKLK